MTFPNFPKRSSSEDDLLDQALNSRALGDQPESASDLAKHALEFHWWADDTRRADPAATGPAADTWNRVLRSTAQENPKGNAMSSAAVISQPQSASRVSSPTTGETIRRYSNLAATIAIVFAVTVGGWFTMSQMQPGGNGRFAAVPGTPEVAQSETCDVEPLTVDEVIAIVENPHSAALDSGSVSPDRSDERGLNEVISYLQIPDQLTEVPNEEDFIEIEKAANTYINCHLDGTVGQLMAVTHPARLQFSVLSKFPVYRDQQMVRDFIESVIDLPAVRVSPAFQQYPEDTSIEFVRTQATSDRNRIRVEPVPGNDMFSGRVAFVGVDTLNENGEVTGETDWDAAILLGDEKDNNGARSMILVYSEATGTWYLYGYNAPRG